jgi:hypothetical protein
VRRAWCARRSRRTAAGGLDPAGIVSTADAACYRAKAAGRNNVQVHEVVLAAAAE